MENDLTHYMKKFGILSQDVSDFRSIIEKISAENKRLKALIEKSKKAKQSMYCKNCEVLQALKESENWEFFEHCHS